VTCRLKVGRVEPEETAVAMQGLGENVPTATSQSQSQIRTDSQSASPSWCQASVWDQPPIFLSPGDFL
jgi:hypothetical protein